MLVKEDRELNPNTSDSRLVYRDGVNVHRQAPKREVVLAKARLRSWGVITLLRVCTYIPALNVASLNTLGIVVP